MNNVSVKQAAKQRSTSSREDMKKELGNAFSINMKNDVKNRLREICVMYGHEDMATRQSGTGRKFSDVISRLIEYHYITRIFVPVCPEQKEIIGIFKDVHHQNLSGKKNEEILDNMIKKEKRRPNIIAKMDDRDTDEEQNWKKGDIDKILEGTKIINLLEKITDRVNKN
ncbi:hypothetical protein KTJ90_11175 [Pantoea jilinensis]|nr:hypothetical protein KTJ90_11175 [Pantoea jilinensis]